MALSGGHILWKIVERPPWKKFLCAQCGGSDDSLGKSLTLRGLSLSSANWGTPPPHLLLPHGEVPAAAAPGVLAHSWATPPEFALQRSLAPDFTFLVCPQLACCLWFWHLGSHFEDHCSINNPEDSRWGLSALCGGRNDSFWMRGSRGGGRWVVQVRFLRAGLGSQVSEIWGSSQAPPLSSREMGMGDQARCPSSPTPRG